ncbi:hypothetical protein AAIH23_41005, partial [Pseudomonas aeruginosa]
VRRSTMGAARVTDPTTCPVNAIGDRSQSFQRSVIHRPRAGSGCRFTLFCFGCSLHALQLLARRQHLAGGFRERYSRCLLRR